MRGITALALGLCVWVVQATSSVALAEEIVFESASPDTGKFEELKIEKSLVIEAKVERPQVQFPLLKEPPPEKEIPFEASFREELLKAPRENTFKLR